MSEKKLPPECLAPDSDSTKPPPWGPAPPASLSPSYTDAARALKMEKMDATAGEGIWVHEGHHLNAAIRVPGTSQTNQTGELAAIVAALQRADPLTPLKFITDSRYVIDGLKKHLRTWEDNGWTETQNAEWFRAAAFHFRYRAAPTLFQWFKGH